MNSFLAKKIDALIDAEEAVIGELETLYPMHTAVRCWLMSGQINPSIGRVQGHIGGRFALVQIRLESRTNEVRSVSAKNIVP
jgi:hypothetical protein